MTSQNKRENSVSLSDLQVLSERIKRCAISVDGTVQVQRGHSNINMSVQMPPEDSDVIHIMSTSKSNFTDVYQLLGEIGRGGFSTVFRCKHLISQQIYAVKVVDLRPLRLRERFNPARIRREVDIMKRLSHPNIIQFVDVFETADQLMMVMEFFAGDELFDVILARKYFTETDAKPVFAQICRALFYLHSLNIIHRDIKPENVLISSEPDPMNGYPIAKLVDFGLSKNAGGGSAAKTFVGTPCYLAPEVEYTSKGLGGTYGLPADCWSLGALLYVMLVARFPEFEQDQTGKTVLRLPPALWDGVSSEAKELIRSLMNANPNARCTVGGALQHPWLASFRASPEELRTVALSCYDLSQGLQAEEEGLNRIERMNDVDEDIVNPQGVQRSAMVVRVRGDGANTPGNEFALSSLLHLQRRIAACLQDAHMCFLDIPDAAALIRRAATLCRYQLTQSMKMLRQVEQTAIAVVGLFPDLELAVEEGEPTLALEFFRLVRSWVVELRALVLKTQKVHKHSMQQIQELLGKSIAELQRRSQPGGPVAQIVALSERLYDLVVERKLLVTQDSSSGSGSGVVGPTGAAVTPNLSPEDVLELFVSLFGPPGQVRRVPGGTGRVALQIENQSDINGVVHSDPESERSASSTPSSPSQDSLAEASRKASMDNNNNLISNATVGNLTHRTRLEDDMAVDNVSNLPTESAKSFAASLGRLTPASGISGNTGSNNNSSKLADLYTKFDAMGTVRDSNQKCDSNQIHGQVEFADAQLKSGRDIISSSSMVIDVSGGSADMSQRNSAYNHITTIATSRASRQAEAAARLNEALENLAQIDLMLEHFGLFWSNTEVVLDVLTKKGQHAEQLVGFASKPKLMGRFKERLEEYKRFWESVTVMCSNYVFGVGQTTEDMGSSHSSQDGRSSVSSTSKTQDDLYGFIEKDEVGTMPGPPLGFTQSREQRSRRDRAASSSSVVGNSVPLSAMTVNPSHDSMQSDASSSHSVISDTIPQRQGIRSHSDVGLPSFLNGQPSLLSGVSPASPQRHSSGALFNAVEQTPFNVAYSNQNPYLQYSPQTTATQIQASMGMGGLPVFPSIPPQTLTAGGAASINPSSSQYYSNSKSYQATSSVSSAASTQSFVHPQPHYSQSAVPTSARPSRGPSNSDTLPQTTPSTFNFAPPGIQSPSAGLLGRGGSGFTQPTVKDQ